MSVMATRKRPPRRTDDAPRERKGKPLNVWIDERIRDALDVAVARSRPRSSLKYVVEVALEEWLRSQNLLPLPSEEP